MQDEKLAAKFQQRAAEVRTIAKGIFDKAERQTLLRFVNDSEKLAAEIARKARG
jgi:hypothetical protein